MTLRSVSPAPRGGCAVVLTHNDVRRLGVAKGECVLLLIAEILRREEQLRQNEKASASP